MEALLNEVSSGNPVLVLQNLGLSWAPQWHYAVVVGFDLAQEDIILRSGLEPRLHTAMDTFELTWARSRYWGLVVLPPDRLPATAEAARYLQAVVPLENIKRWDLAHTAYRTVLRRWPDNLVALMGLGNSAYRLGQLDAAREAFQAAVQHHPAAGAAHNNLAQVLLEQGRLEEAHQHAKQAVALGGAQRASFQETLQAIEKRLGK
jgi:tetratricopeptide (TPR) repeat protein